MDKKTRDTVVALCHRRWTVPVLARLYTDAGCKFVTLVHGLGLSRDTLSATLSMLMERGWVARNPGYGHPMRPEYVLTPEGLPWAAWCALVMRVVAALRAPEVCFRKWSIPVALALSSGSARFNELRRTLPRLTARALASTLKELQGAGLVERMVGDEYPPATYYALTREGKRLARLAVLP